MSDYCKYKVVRYPIFHGKEYYSEYDRLDELVSEIRKEKRVGSENLNATICIDYTTDTPYLFLDYELYYSYGEESNEYAKTRRLTPTEQEKYKQIFDELLRGKDYIVIDPEKFRLVEFSYYNCCEAQAYYDETTDPFYDPI